MSLPLSEPVFKLVYKGIDISSEIDPMLISCTYTDKLHGEADEIEVTVQDKDGKWRGSWCPEHGDIVELWIGYKGGPLVYCGAFEIDEPSAKLGRGSDTFSFRGVAAPVTKSLRTKKSKGFDDKSLKDIVGEIAGQHGLSVTGEVPDIKFQRITQRRERDLEFLTRLADQYGAYFSVRGKQLVFDKRDNLHNRAPVMTIAANSGLYKSADLKKASHKTYSKAKLGYFDGDTKKKIEAEESDAKVKNGDVLRLDDRVENEGQAKARVKSDLQRANMKKQTGSLTLVGNPLILSGQIIELAGDFGKWAGRYIIQQSRHPITRGGYEMTCDIAVV